MSPPRLAIIGAGHLGCAIIGGLIAAGFPRQKLVATCARPESAAAVRQRFAIEAHCDNQAAASQSEVLLFCVKPAMLPKVAQELATTILANKLPIISAAAGVTLPQLRSYLAENSPIIRAMPNTPALVGWSATALYTDEYSSPAQRQIAEQIFNSIGSTLWLNNEDHLYGVTALSGSGPAYFFILMQALEEAALAMGLPLDIAKPLIVQTALGSAHMVDKTDLSPAELCRQVSSPGGGTEQALKVLEAENFRELLIKAVTAAEQRYRELAAGDKN